jgi:twinkle protein
VKGEAGAIINAIHQAADYRPDGIVSMSDMRETVATPDAESPLKYPYPRLNFMTKGMRGITTLVSGSGCGKSTLVREIAYHLHMTGSTVGMLMLEENTKRTSQGLVGLHINRNIAVDPEAATKDEIVAGFDDLVSNGEIYLFDHVGTFDLDIICSRIRYMKHGLGCDVVFLDHISILISSYSGSGGDNERVLIDHIMHTLTALCVEIDLALVLVSHLKRPKSERGHEGGDKAQLSQLRGSHSLAQLAWFCIALNVDEEDPTSGRRQLTILKNRHTGFLGSADTLQYNSDTGRLMAVDDNFGF